MVRSIEREVIRRLEDGASKISSLGNILRVVGALGKRMRERLCQ